MRVRRDPAGSVDIDAMIGRVQRATASESVGGVTLTDQHGGRHNECASRSRGTSRERCLHGRAPPRSSASALGTVPCASRGEPPPRPPAAVSASLEYGAGIDARVFRCGDEHRRRAMRSPRSNAALRQRSERLRERAHLLERAGVASHYSDAHACRRRRVACRTGPEPCARRARLRGACAPPARRASCSLCATTSAGASAPTP